MKRALVLSASVTLIVAACGGSDGPSANSEPSQAAVAEEPSATERAATEPAATEPAATEPAAIDGDFVSAEELLYLSNCSQGSDGIQTVDINAINVETGRIRSISSAKSLCSGTSGPRTGVHLSEDRQFVYAEGERDFYIVDVQTGSTFAWDNQRLDEISEGQAGDGLGASVTNYRAAGFSQTESGVVFFSTNESRYVSVPTEVLAQGRFEPQDEPGESKCYTSSNWNSNQDWCELDRQHIVPTNPGEDGETIAVNRTVYCGDSVHWYGLGDEYFISGNAFNGVSIASNSATRAEQQCEIVFELDSDRPIYYFGEIDGTPYVSSPTLDSTAVEIYRVDGLSESTLVGTLPDRSWSLEVDY